MANDKVTENKFDPAKTFVGTRLIKDTNETGSPLVDENTGEWLGGRILVELFDLKTGENIGGYEEKVTRNKYLAWKEDFDPMTKEEVISKYFKNVKVGELSQTDLQKEAEKSSEETKLREALARVAELEAKAERREEVEQGMYVDNVRPVGDPGKEVSNPEQEFSNEQMIAKGADASGSNNVENPEQSAPNVPEDKFKKTGGNTDKPSKTAEVERNVKPVGADAKTNKDVAKTEENLAKSNTK